MFKTKPKFGNIFMFAGLITAAMNGFSPNYTTELLLWMACFSYAVYD
jgi:hypothetical protein